MVQPRENSSSEVTERDMRHSGIPAPGKLGAGKKQVWALIVGLVVLSLIFVAAIVDMQF